jgi:hypothetical protein
VNDLTFEDVIYVIDEKVHARESSHFCLLCNGSLDWPETCMFWVVTYSTAEISPKIKAIAIVSLAVLISIR